MTEQTRNITDAVIAKNQEDRLKKMRIASATKKVQKLEKYLNVLRSLHLYGSTFEEVEEQRTDPYFSSWFKDAEEGDIQVMHSILDHFEPLQIITNLGHNYRIKFSKDAAEIKLDFRPESKLPKLKYFVDGETVGRTNLDDEEQVALGKSYLYSVILRMAKELTLYFPVNKISFSVTCPHLCMEMEKFGVSEDEVKFFLAEPLGDDFNQIFEDKIL